MSEFKGTKGKWNIKNIAYDKQWINISSEKGIIARTFYGEQEPIVTKSESEANALLISKAPEMLEMLKLFTDFPDEDFKENESNNYYTFSVKISDMIKAKQLIKEATEL
jgi:hypothetical protein